MLGEPGGVVGPQQVVGVVGATLGVAVDARSVADELHPAVAVVAVSSTVPRATAANQPDTGRRAQDGRCRRTVLGPRRTVVETTALGFCNRDLLQSTRSTAQASYAPTRPRHTASGSQLRIPTT